MLQQKYEINLEKRQLHSFKLLAEWSNKTLTTQHLPSRNFYMTTTISTQATQLCVILTDKGFHDCYHNRKLLTSKKNKTDQIFWVKYYKTQEFS